MTRRRMITFAAAAALLVVSACASGSSHNASGSAHDQAASTSNAGGTSHTVHLPKSYKFDPSSIQVKVGDQVTWVNEDDFPHTVKLLTENQVNKLSVGESVTLSFPRAGVFPYICTLHPTQMKGEVVVKDPSA